MERPDYVNIDFERSLALGYPANSFSMNAEWEYVYFFINKKNSSLKNLINYDQEYLDYLKSLELVIPSFLPDSEKYKNWIGDIDEYSVQLNSKSNLIEYRNNFGLDNHGSFIANSSNDLDINITSIKSDRVLIKDPWGVSGKGQQARKKEDILKTKKFPCVVEPLFNRVADFSFTRDNAGIQIVQNFIGKNRNFEGGMVVRDRSFWIEMFSLFGISFDEIESNVDKIFCELEEKYNAGKKLHIDSFIYKENGSFDFWPICEINHRVTMADLPLSLTTFGYGLFFLMKINNLPKFNKWGDVLSYFGNSLYDSNTKMGIIPLTPVSSPHSYQFFSIYVAARSVSEIVEIVEKSPLKLNLRGLITL